MGDKARKKTAGIQSKDTKYQYENEGQAVVILNPAGVMPEDKLAEADKAGQPVLHHRDNTPWYLTVPGLVNTIPFEVDGKLLQGFIPLWKLFQYADKMITWLKELSPEELRAVQEENATQDFVNWPKEYRDGQKIISGELSNR